MRRHVPGFHAMTAAQAFGRTVASLRQSQKIEIEELATRSGMDAVTVAAIEIGADEPDLKEIFQLAEALGVEATRLMADMEALMGGW
jgi:transcriptional regulator with XRE-family HTH domain